MARKTTKRTSKVKGKTGPKLDTLKIGQDWESAVDVALKKERPAEGWPKFPKEPSKD